MKHSARRESSPHPTTSRTRESRESMVTTPHSKPKTTVCLFVYLIVCFATTNEVEGNTGLFHCDIIAC